MDQRATVIQHHRCLEEQRKASNRTIRVDNFRLDLIQLLGDRIELLNALYQGKVER